MKLPIIKHLVKADYIPDSYEEAVDALISTVASPSIRSTPSLDCCIKDAASPNISLFVLLIVSPVPFV